MNSFQIVKIEDAAYPPSLARLLDAPPSLYVQGDPACLSEPSIAVVGSRKATAYGREVAGNLSEALGTLGIVTVSGLASGIDTAVHEGSLRSGGKTIAVMGTGPDIIFPPENKNLAREIIARGAVLTEYSPGTPGLPHHFPARNRIIAGLSLGTLVVEAAERSGALITARLAAEQGKEVFAVPGPITSPASGGTNRLISEGAKLTRSVDDILVEIEIFKNLLQKPVDPKSVKPALALTTEEQDLLNLISLEPQSIDRLLEKFGGGSGRIANTLLGLELKGAVRALPGKRYVRES